MTDKPVEEWEAGDHIDDLRTALRGPSLCPDPPSRDALLRAVIWMIRHTPSSRHPARPDDMTLLLRLAYKHKRTATIVVLSAVVGFSSVMGWLGGRGAVEGDLKRAVTAMLQQQVGPMPDPSGGTP